VISSWSSISQSIKIDQPLYSDRYGVRNLEVEKSVESNGPLGLVKIPFRCSLFINDIDRGDDEYLFRESINKDVATLSLLSYPIKIGITVESFNLNLFIIASWLTIIKMNL
jgi:hypothetical protein